MRREWHSVRNNRHQSQPPRRGDPARTPQKERTSVEAIFQHEQDFQQQLRQLLVARKNDGHKVVVHKPERLNPLIPLAALTALIERTKDGHRLGIARRVLAAYLALDILSGILGIWLYDVYAFSLFVPFYSRFALAINANIVRYQSYGYLPAFDMLLRYVYYIAYWLNFALLLRSLSKRIRQGEQTEESQ